MARNHKTVKIELDDKKTKDFTVWELSILNIIELSQNNLFFKSSDQDIKETQNGQESAKNKADSSEKETPVEEEKGFLNEIAEYGDEIQRIMDMSCDFNLTDLKKDGIAPSDIRKLWDAFQEVNVDFLDVLEKLKIIEVVGKLMSRHLNSFSKMLAIL